MKKARKIVSIIVTLCFLLTLVPAGAFAAPKDTETPFDDVQTTDWFYDTVQYVYDEGLMAGTGDRIFSPQQTTTRGMIVTILHRMAGSPEAEAQDFTDVDPDAWYAPAINWSIESGVGAGYGGGLFGPDDAITREQMASFLYRYAELEGYDVSAVGDLDDFADASEVSNWAEDVMSWAVGADLFAGRDNNNLAPQGLTTRAEAATILMRYCENIVGKSAEDPSDEPSDDPSDEPDSPDTDDPSEDNPSIDPTPDEPSIAETFTVTFDSDGGSAVAAQKVKDGEKAKEPAVPTKDGFVFMGWQLADSAESYDFSEPVTGDLSLIAIWATDVGDGDSIYTLENEQVSFDEEEQLYYVNNILLVSVEKGLNDVAKQQIADLVNGSIAGDISGDYNLLQIQVNASSYSELNTMAEKLMQDHRVMLASPDLPTPDEKEDDYKLIFDNYLEGGDWWYGAVRADEAWGKYSSYFSEITVGVVDSGIDSEHEDLSGKISFASPLFEANNNSFYVDENYYALNHGTGVAGVLAAKHDENGIDGIAGNANIVFASWELENAGDAEWESTTSDLYAISCVLAHEEQPKIINCSYTRLHISKDVFEQRKQEEIDNHVAESECKYNYASYDDYLAALRNSANINAQYYSDVMCQLIKSGKDLLVVHAAGNGENNAGPGVDAIYAAGWAAITQENSGKLCQKYGMTFSELEDHFLVVSGTKKGVSDGKYHVGSDFNYGETVDICAPGIDINTLRASRKGNNYGKTEGTSLAAPIVSGVAALVWSVNPSLSAGDVRDILLQNHLYEADITRDGVTYTYPMVDAYAAVKAAVEGVENTVSGRVLDADVDPKTPIENVTVTVSDASGKEISTTTAETGAFTAIVDEPGTYTLTFSKDGYKTVVKTDVKIQGRGTIGDIEMTSSVSGDNIFAQLPSEFVFTSGAGGWATELTLNDDGSFTGQYYDYNLGITGPNYPNGSAYICNFTGKFSTPQKISEYVYSMELESLETEGTPDSVYYKDGIQYTVAKPYGITENSNYLIYLPGCPSDDLDAGFIGWASIKFDNRDSLPVGVYGIYNVNDTKGFVGRSENSPWYKDYIYSYNSYRSELWPRYSGQSSLNFWPSSGAATLSLRFDWNGEQHAEIVASDYNGTGNYYVVLDFDDEYRSVKVDVTSVSGYNLEPWGGTSEGTLSAEYTLS